MSVHKQNKDIALNVNIHVWQFSNILSSTLYLTYCLRGITTIYTWNTSLNERLVENNTVDAYVSGGGKSKLNLVDLNTTLKPLETK